MPKSKNNLHNFEITSPENVLHHPTSHKEQEEEEKEVGKEKQEEEEEEEEENESEEEEEKGVKPYMCYLIQNTGRRTYVGITNRFEHRLRQHNGLIKGGAKATRGRGPWSAKIHVLGFKDKSEVQRFEYRCHHPNLIKNPQHPVKLPKRAVGYLARLRVFQELLQLPHWSHLSMQLF